LDAGGKAARISRITVYAREGIRRSSYVIIAAMKVLVYFFAQSREIVGESQQEFEIDDGSDVTRLLNVLVRQFPGLKKLDIRVAVNSDYAENSHLLHDGDEVAIIPPISGG